MKYILKYEMKSKYFGFIKTYYKEFNNLFDIFNFITNDKTIINYIIYSKDSITYTELLKGE